MQRLHAPFLLAAALTTGLVGVTGFGSSAGATPGGTPSSAGLQVNLPFEKYKLSNGMEVILHHDARTANVAINIWYHVGSKDEQKGKSGFAHLFEHLMFQGSRNVGEDMFFKYLERAGVSERNGTTNPDRTNYYETVPANELELVLWLESDRMGFLLDHVNQATLESQRAVVLNERRQSYENQPYGMVGMLTGYALYPEGHPYYEPTIGSPEDLGAASLDDVRAFFRRYYAPSNATLAIAGNYDVNRTKALVEQYFGSLPGGSSAGAIKQPQVPILTSTKTVRIEADVELPRLVITWPTPPRFAAGDAELDLASQVLSDGTSSRLYKTLVYDKQIAQSVSAYQASAMLGSEFEISVTLRNGYTPQEALPIVDAELKRLLAEQPSAAELERARNKLLSSLVFAMEDISHRADALNEYNQMAGTPDHFREDLLRYQRPTSADLSAAVANLLPLDRRVLTFVEPNKAAPRAGRLKALPKAQP